MLKSEAELITEEMGKMTPEDIGQNRLKFDLQRKEAFLIEFRRLGFAKAACHSVRIGVRTMYDAKTRDSEFARQFSEIKEEWDEHIEREIHRRAVEGVERPVIQGGKMVMEESRDERGEVIMQEAVDGADPEPVMIPLVLREYSDRLLEFWARARMPDKYGNKVQLDSNVSSGVLVVEEVAKLEDFGKEMAVEEEHRLLRLEEDKKKE